MHKLKLFLIHQSEERNSWSLPEEKVQELCKLVDESLFKITPETIGPVINSAKTISYMVKEGKFKTESILIEFTNYLLGSLFKQNPEIYPSIRDAISKKLLDGTSYNLKSINPDIVKKYFSNQEIEYEFITDNSIHEKAS